MTRLEPCVGCQLLLAPAEGATDPYAGASAACWAEFGEVTARDYGEFRYPPIHRAIVDAYMAQHPGFATPAGRRSVAVHLVGLYLALDVGLSSDAVLARIANVFPDKPDIAPLHPVPASWDLTVRHMRGAETLEDHTRRALAWAHAVWRAWMPHHDQVRAWASRAAPKR